MTAKQDEVRAQLRKLNRLFTPVDKG
jgi:hypothetical protein